MKIEVDIGELNLHGFRAAERYRIGEGVKAELEGMLRHGGLAAGFEGERGRGAISPERQIASVIYREIRRAL